MCSTRILKNINRLKLIIEYRKSFFTKSVIRRMNYFLENSDIDLPMMRKIENRGVVSLLKSAREVTSDMEQKETPYISPSRLHTSMMTIKNRFPEKRSLMKKNYARFFLNNILMRVQNTTKDL